MSKSTINKYKLVKRFINNTDKISESLKGHDEFQCSIRIYALDGKDIVQVNINDIEEYGEIFFVEVVFKSYWLSYSLTYGDTNFSIQSKFIFRRNEESSFSYEEIFSVLNIEEFREINFPLVLDEETIDIAVDRISEFAMKYIGEFIKAYRDDHRILDKLEEQKRQWDLLENVRAKGLIRRIRLYRGFNAYICGDFKKSVKNYNSIKSYLTKYELMRLEYMSEVLKDRRENNYDKEDYRLLRGYKLLREHYKHSLPEILSLYLGWIPMSAIISIVFIAIYYGFLVLDKESIFILISGVEMTLVPSLLIGIAAYTIPRKFILKAILKDKYKDYIAVDTFYNGKFYLKTLPILTGFIIILSSVFMVFGLNWNIKFLEDRLLDNSNFFDIKPRSIMYTQIEAIYREEKFRNSYNEVIEAPSYFIKLKNGKILDMRILMYDIEGFENIALPYLIREMQIPLRQVELKEDII